MQDLCQVVVVARVARLVLVDGKCCHPFVAAHVLVCAK